MLNIVLLFLSCEINNKEGPAAVSCDDVRRRQLDPCPTPDTDSCSCTDASGPKWPIPSRVCCVGAAGHCCCPLAPQPGTARRLQNLIGFPLASSRGAYLGWPQPHHARYRVTGRVTIKPIPAEY